LLDVGGFAGEELDLVQTDAEGRAERIETFGVDHLADAVARLYELYADSLPDGPPRARPVAPARPLAPMLTAPLDADLSPAALGSGHRGGRPPNVGNLVRAWSGRDAAAPPLLARPQPRRGRAHRRHPRAAPRGVARAPDRLWHRPRRRRLREAVHRPRRLRQ